MVMAVDAATAKLEVLVEKEVAGRFAGLDGESGQGLVFVVEEACKLKKIPLRGATVAPDQLIGLAPALAHALGLVVAVDE